VKIKHILEGVKNHGESEITDKEDGLVFYQFGKYLSDKSSIEPIVDQHVIRAFKVYKSEDNQVDFFRRLQILKGRKNQNYILEYKKWLLQESNSSDLKNHEDYIYHIDQILFALGKTIKLKNK
jgi:hypothetical protein